MIYLIIMVVQGNEFFISRALRLAMMDGKLSKLLALPAHWVETSLSELVRARTLARAFLYKHLQMEVWNLELYTCSTWVIRQHFRVSSFLAPPSPILALVIGAMARRRRANMVRFRLCIETMSQEPLTLTNLRISHRP